MWNKIKTWFRKFYNPIYDKGWYEGFNSGYDNGKRHARYLMEESLKDKFMISKSEMAEYLQLRHKKQPAQRAEGVTSWQRTKRTQHQSGSSNSQRQPSVTKRKA